MNYMKTILTVFNVSRFNFEFYGLSLVSYSSSELAFQFSLELLPYWLLFLTFSIVLEFYLLPCSWASITHHMCSSFFTSPHLGFHLILGKKLAQEILFCLAKQGRGDKEVQSRL